MRRPLRGIDWLASRLTSQFTIQFARRISGILIIGLMILSPTFNPTPTMMTPIPLPSLTSTTSIRIMPLGDSLTEGYPQMQGGYRIPLWAGLTASGITAEFVGTMTDSLEWAQPHHEGHSGWKIDDLSQNIGGWIATSQPDIILMLIGTNDILNGQHDGMSERYGTLINQIFAAKPDVRLIVSRIPPIGESVMNAQVETFNAALPDVVSHRAQTGQRISLVDLYAPFTSADLLDGVHLIDSAYPRMAEVWLTELRDLLLSPVQALTPVAFERVHTPFYTFTWTQSANPDATYKIKIKDLEKRYKHVEKNIAPAFCVNGICRAAMSFQNMPPNHTTLRWKIITDGQSSGWRPFVTDMPGTPNLIKPANGALLEPPLPRFVWSPVPDAEQMQLVIDQINLSDDQGGMNGKRRVVEFTFSAESIPLLTEVCDPGARRCSVKLESLGIPSLTNGDYRWSIKTRSAFGKGRSEKWQFSVHDGIVRDDIIHDAVVPASTTVPASTPPEGLVPLPPPVP